MRVDEGGAGTACIWGETELGRGLREVALSACTGGAPCPRVRPGSTAEESITAEDTQGSVVGRGVDALFSAAARLALACNELRSTSEGEGVEARGPDGACNVAYLPPGEGEDFRSWAVGGLGPSRPRTGVQSGRRVPDGPACEEVPGWSARLTEGREVHALRGSVSLGLRSSPSFGFGGTFSPSWLG